MVYCPRCGRVVAAKLRTCPDCRESLSEAMAIDTGEQRQKNRRIRSLKREEKRQAWNKKKEAAFTKFPILKPLYTTLWVFIILGIICLLGYLASLSDLAAVIVFTICFCALYAWYAPYIINNIDDICPPHYNYEKNLLRRSLWGLVVGGGFVIVLAINLIFAMIFE